MIYLSLNDDVEQDIPWLTQEDVISTALKKRRDPSATRSALIEAAQAEFNEAGYEHTHSNRIAQRAGYAPQTFYRHFKDKDAVFMVVYETWVASEGAALQAARTAQEAASIIAAHHKTHLGFRRSLRLLSVTRPDVRAARAASRRKQIQFLKAELPPLRRRPQAEIAAALLTVERLADACAEGEFEDLGLTGADGLDRLARALAELGFPR